jgi:hypothetical protein
MTRLYHRPELFVDDNGRTRINKAVWNHETMATYCLTNGVNNWIKIGDLARVVWGRNTPSFCRAVRRRLSGFKRQMALMHNQLIVVEYNDVRGSASALKVYDYQSLGDRQAMEKMLTEMESRKDNMLDYYRRTTRLSGLESTKTKISK